MTDEAIDFERYGKLEASVLLGQIALLATLANHLIKKGLIDREELNNDLTKVLDICRAQDEIGLGAAAFAQFVKSFPEFRGL